MTTRYRQGTPVRSSDGTDLGSIERLVVDPSQSTVTHLVISQGLIFPEERVVPCDIIASGDDTVVELDEQVELDDLPLFERDEYIPLEESDLARMPEAGGAPSLAWSKTIYAAAPLVGGGAAVYPTYPPGTVPVVKRAVPDDSSIIEGGSSVVAADGERVGKVARLSVDDDGVISSVTVDPGWFRSEQVIPAHFIERIDDDEVVLAIGAASLRRLQA